MAKGTHICISDWDLLINIPCRTETDTPRFDSVLTGTHLFSHAVVTGPTYNALTGSEWDPLISVPFLGHKDPLGTLQCSSDWDPVLQIPCCTECDALTKFPCGFDRDPLTILSWC